MRSKFDQQLQMLNALLIDMGVLIETAIDQSITALKNRMLRWRKQ